MSSTTERRDIATVAVVLAGGSGSRSGLEYPKQFLRLGGRTVLEHTLGVFDADPLIDRVVVVGPEEWLDTIRDLVLGSGVTKVVGVLPGGRTRNESTRAATDFLVEQGLHPDSKVLYHDAVRPFLGHDVIRRCVDALDDAVAVDTVIETADTIVEVDNAYLERIPTRSRLRRGQTPQGFRLGVLHRAYRAVTPRQLAGFSDDCAVILATLPDAKIRTVQGDEANIKITRPMDIYLADRLLQSRQSPVPGGDVALKLEGCVLVVGGTSGIGAAVVDRVRAAGGHAVAVGRRDGFDIRFEPRVAGLLHDVRLAEGPIAAVVNTAGVLRRGSLIEMSVDDLRAHIDVNLTGAIHLARHAHPYLKETRGHLQLFTSSSFTRGRQGYAAYSATKAGVVNLVQALSEEWLPDRIKVNCINPARTRTPMRSAAFGEEPADTLLDPDTVAGHAVRVLTGSMTGHVFDVRLDHD